MPRRLIDAAGADMIHGHSSHHLRGIDVYKGRPILYGCGDFLNDYEGIGGYEEFRGDLALMYFITMDTSTGKLVELCMNSGRIGVFRIGRAVLKIIEDTPELVFIELHKPDGLVGGGASAGFFGIFTAS